MIFAVKHGLQNDSPLYRLRQTLSAAEFLELGDLLLFEFKALLSTLENIPRGYHLCIPFFIHSEGTLPLLPLMEYRHFRLWHR